MHRYVIICMGPPGTQYLPLPAWSWQVEDSRWHLYRHSPKVVAARLPKCINQEVLSHSDLSSLLPLPLRHVHWRTRNNELSWKMRQENIGQHCSELGRRRGKPGIQDNLHVKTSPVEKESDYRRVSEVKNLKGQWERNWGWQSWREEKIVCNREV